MKFSKTLPWLPALLVLAGCPGQPPQLDKVSVTCTPTPVVAGQSAQCSASALDQHGDAFPVSSFSWSSGDEAIARVDASGSVSTLVVSGGDVAIRASATSGDKTAQGETTLSVTPKPPTVHSAPVSSSETWRASDNPHLVSAALSVDSGATLSLEPGLVLRFAPGAGLRVAQGRLLAPGTAAAPILLQAQNGATRGSWSALVFAAKATASSLEHVTLSGCGGGQDTGACLVIRDGAAPVLKDVAVRDSASTGVLVTGEGSAFGADSARLSVSGSTGAAVRIHANQASTLPLGGSFSGNTPNAVELTGPSVSRTQTWPNPSIPYVVTEDLIVNNKATPITLTIAAGTQVRFASGVKLIAAQGYADDKPGALVLDGKPEAPILFTAHSDNPQPGHWRGVHVRSDAPGRISHATIEYAGQEPVPDDQSTAGQGNLNLYASATGNSVFTLTDLTVRKSSGPGLFMDVELASGSTRLTSRDNATYPIQMMADAVRSLPAGLDFQNNGLNMVSIFGGSVYSTQTWPNLGMPYRLQGTIFIGAQSNPTLTIAPGTEIRVAPGTAIVVGADKTQPGVLVAKGTGDTASTSIRFVPDVSPAAGGYWSGIHFWNAKGSRLDHVLVTHGGGDGDPYFKYLLFGSGNISVYKDELGGFVTNSRFERAKECAATRSETVTTYLLDPSFHNHVANNPIDEQCLN